MASGTRKRKAPAKMASAPHSLQTSQRRPFLFSFLQNSDDPICNSSYTSSPPDDRLLSFLLHSIADDPFCNSSYNPLQPDLSFLLQTQRRFDLSFLLQIHRRPSLSFLLQIQHRRRFCHSSYNPSFANRSVFLLTKPASLAGLFSCLQKTNRRRVCLSAYKTDPSVVLSFVLQNPHRQQVCFPSHKTKTPKGFVFSITKSTEKPLGGRKTNTRKAGLRASFPCLSRFHPLFRFPLSERYSTFRPPFSFLSKTECGTTAISTTYFSPATN